jgi:GTP-binding protein HflX
MGPRIYGLGGTVLSRQGGGIGTRGLGETNIELMKRHWRNEMKKVQEKLTKLEADRARKMQHRTEKGFRTISIIGYTNAGKTTLFNRLTKKNKLAEDILFATLDSSIGKIYLPQLKSEVLVTDTIGFIQNLPPQLIQAFKSTLLESIHADLLLHVIDASDPTLHMKIEVVEKVLKDLGIKDKKQLYVFNKTDVIPNLDEENMRQVYEFYQPQFISVVKNSNIDALLFTIEKQLQHL